MSHPLSARCVRGGRVLVLFLVGCGLVAALAAGPAAAVMNNQQYGFLNQIGGPGAGVGQFGGGSNPGPYGVAVDAVGNVFAVDPNTSGDHVQKFASNGSFVCSFGSFGQNEGELAVPYGIAVGADGTVYVLDTYRADQNRIQKYVSADGGLTYSSAGQVSISPLDGDAYFMAVDAGGNMYVAEKNGGVGNDVNRILKYAPGGGAAVATIGSTGSGVDQIDGANGVAVRPMAPMCTWRMAGAGTSSAFTVPTAPTTSRPSCSAAPRPACRWATRLGSASTRPATSSWSTTTSTAS